MDILAILAEARYRADSDEVVEHLLGHPEAVPVVVRSLRNSDDILLVQRAAMTVGNFSRRCPAGLFPYLPALLDAATHPLHPAVQRNVIRYFSELPVPAIPESLHGRLADLVLRLADDVTAPTAIRVFAMQTAANLVTRYPDLASELATILRSHLPGATPGYRSRAAKILAVLPD